MGRFPMPFGMGQLGFERDLRAAGIVNRHPDTPAALRVPVMKRHGIQAQKFSNTCSDSHASNLMHGTAALRNLRDGQGGIFDPRNAMNKNDARPQLEGNTTCRICVSKIANCFCPEVNHKATANYQSDFLKLVSGQGHVKNPPSASLPRSKSKAMATTERLSNFKWFSTLRVRDSHRCPS